MNPEISIVHPSRMRPELAAKTYDHWVSQMSGKHTFEYIVSIDKNDPLAEEYVKIFKYRSVTLIQNDNRSLVDASNRGAEITNGKIIILVSDDFLCFQNWDEELIKAFDNHECIVLKTWDGIQKWIVTLPIMDRAYYTRAGFFYNPEYLHMFADTEMTHKADIEGKLVFRNDLSFIHAHYTTNMNRRDQVNERADKTWVQGEAVYLRRVRENFGLPASEIVRGISHHGKASENWINNKLKTIK